MSPLNSVQLLCFDTIAREGSFRRAAAALGLAQPSVSMHIENLEKTLGMKLLQRSPRGASVTAAGKSLLPHVRSALRADEVARQHAASLLGRTEGRVRIGGVSGTVSTIAPEAVRMTLERHGELVFEVFQMTASAVRDQVLDGTIDIGLLLDFTDAEFPGVHAELLTHGPVMFVAREGHHLLSKQSITRSEAASEPMILLSEGDVLRERVLEYFHGHHLTVVGEADSHDTVRRLVSAGVGVTLLPSMNLSNGSAVPSNLRGRPMAEVPSQPGLWLIHLDQHLPPAAQTFIASVREIVSNSR